MFDLFPYPAVGYALQRRSLPGNRQWHTWGFPLVPALFEQSYKYKLVLLVRVLSRVFRKIYKLLWLDGEVIAARSVGRALSNHAAWDKMADCSRWKAGREKKSPPVVVAKERTGMVTVLVCNVVEVQRIETLSYDTGEKASGSILKLKVRVGRIGESVTECRRVLRSSANRTIFYRV